MERGNESLKQRKSESERGTPVRPFTRRTGKPGHRSVAGDHGRTGCRQVSARAIAKRIGYSPGTLYNLFENIDAIVYQVNAATLRDLAMAAMAAVENQTQPLDRAVALGRAYVDFAEAQPQLWLAVFDFRPAAEGDSPAGFEEAVTLLFAVVNDCLTPFFTAEQEDLRAASGRVLWSGVHGISLLNVTGRLGQPDGMTAADMAELLIRNFIRGLEA